MNKLSGDGCSLFCRREDSFNCIGKSVSFLGAQLVKGTVRDGQINNSSPED